MFEVWVDLSRWRAEIPRKVIAKAESLSGPTTPREKEYRLLMLREVKQDLVVPQRGKSYNR
jgi:hypothetical protein